jgi:AraC-like DNA-binding protein
MPSEAAVTVHALDATPALRGHVDGMVAVCVAASSAPPACMLLPYDGFLLGVRLPHPGIEPGADGVAPVRCSLWPLRSRPVHWQLCEKGALTLRAMLRPAAALALMREQRFGELPRQVVPLSLLTGSAAVKRLESAVCGADSIDAKLRALAAWLEDETVAPLQRDPAARALGSAAAALHAHASMPVAEVAALLGMHRRRLERDFSRWYGASPKQVQLAARLQHIARLAWQGNSAAAIAAELGLVDAPHLSHTVRELTGMTYTGFTRSAALPALSQAFRTVTAGAHLFG